MAFDDGKGSTLVVAVTDRLSLAALARDLREAHVTAQDLYIQLARVQQATTEAKILLENAEVALVRFVRGTERGGSK